MMQSLSGTTSATPPSSSFQRAGPSSSSQLLPFFFAQASRLCPSKSTTAPLGGGAPREGTARITCLSVKPLSLLAPVKRPSLIAPLQPSPLKVTLSPERTPSRTATGSLSVSNAVRRFARYLPPAVGSTWATKPPSPCQSPISGSALAGIKLTGPSAFFLPRAAGGALLSD